MTTHVSNHRMMKGPWYLMTNVPSSEWSHHQKLPALWPRDDITVWHHNVPCHDDLTIWHHCISLWHPLSHMRIVPPIRLIAEEEVLHLPVCWEMQKYSEVVSVGLHPSGVLLLYSWGSFYVSFANILGYFLNFSKNTNLAEPSMAICLAWNQAFLL